MREQRTESEYNRWKGWQEFGVFSPGDAHRFSRLVELHDGPEPAAKVLEIGFGGGAFLGWARANGIVADGVEIDPFQVDRARSMGMRAHSYDEWTAGLGGRYEIVLLLDVLEHVPQSEFDAFMRHVDSSLSSNGSVIVQVPNAASPLSNYIQNGDPTHELRLTRDSIRLLIAGSGFEVVRWIRAYPSQTGSWRSRAVDKARAWAYRALSLATRALCGANIDWWPVAVCVLKRADTRGASHGERR